jgi:hypothetical protein
MGSANNLMAMPIPKLMKKDIQLQLNGSIADGFLFG